MPRINLDLETLKTTRTELAAIESERRAIDADLVAAQTALERAHSSGASPNVTVPLEQGVEEARARRNEAIRQGAQLSARIDELAGGLLQGRDPSQMIEALDARHPIALLPVRLETRYVPVLAPTALRIRVYPDDLNTIEHVPALTPEESEKGRAYWEARFHHDDNEAARLLRDLTVIFGRGRAAMIVRVLTPNNPVPDEGAAADPAFPETETVDARAKATRAVLLPDRWCAIGYAAPRREVFRIWGNRIPDELLLSPDWLATDNPETLLGGDRAWMIDFDAALVKGMALQITQQELNAEALRQHAVPFNLATGTLDRLIVVGVEWTKTAEESVADLTDLLAAHRDSTGLAFAELGTPTNNTESQASGYSPSEERTAGTAAAADASGEKDALQLLMWAFGIAPDQLPPDNIGGAHLADQRIALHMMNALWRGTFGHYLFELWNPDVADDSNRFLTTRSLYDTRWYAMRYLRASGALPLLRVGKQPYGILPIVGKRFVTAGSAVEARIGQLLGVLRPMWEFATGLVPTMTDGDVVKAQQIIQTSAWSQVAQYRDKDASKLMCVIPGPFSEAQGSGRRPVIHALLTAVGISENDFNNAHIFNCNDFLPDPPYEAGPLVGVPWVLADAKDPKKEADDRLPLGDNNYLKQIATASVQVPDTARPLLNAFQSGPALLQALASYSVQMEQGDAVVRFVPPYATVDRVTEMKAPSMPFVEARNDNEAMFTIETPRELAAVSIPSVTGALTLGQHMSAAASVPIVSSPAVAHKAAAELDLSVRPLLPQTRDLGAVKVSLDYLSGRTVGELNIAFRTTLDAFSHRLDAWISARANHRLEQMRENAATGIYVGGVAWVEHLKADRRPDSEGHLLAPSLGQAATAAVLRSGFLANHETGAFDIKLDSERTQRAAGILQGLTRDQPLAALYGYRIERALRDALLGRLIWPLRLAFPWRPAGQNPKDESQEAVGARDVVDGVALLALWEEDPTKVRDRLKEALTHLEQPPAALDPDWNAVSAVIEMAADLADSVADLLLAEGTHQIMQGNLDRAAAAMAIVDKQSLPIETAFNTTQRGGAGYTQRLVAFCPDADDVWPGDDRSQAEPAINAWLASMLGDPAQYRFVTAVHRGVDGNGDPIVDAVHPTVSLSDLGLSPLSAVLLSAVPSAPHVSSRGETGFRSALVDAFIAGLVSPDTVTGLDIGVESDDAAHLGLGHFEAIAATLKAVIDKARPAARHDLVKMDDALEPKAPTGEGQFPGVAVGELVTRADDAENRFTTLTAAVAASAAAVPFLSALAAMDAYLPSRNWPAEVFAIDAAGANPAERDARAMPARDAVMRLLDARQAALDAPIPLMEGQVAASDGQRVQNAIDRIKLLFGKDFPVLPRFTLGPYATEFDASLGDQTALTVNDPWRINGWLTQLGCVREGANRYTSALAAHEALVSPADAGDFTVVQFPHRAGQVWAALPEAWIQPDDEAPDPKDAPPEELKDFVADRPGVKYRNIQRTAPTLTIACHRPGGFDAPAADTTLAAMVCDEWAEFIPDPFQTAGIGFHYDAPGARPPQSVLLALPPRLDQDAWTFDDLLDVIHEAFDLAKVRAVRPQDLKGGLGALLPGNYLPHTYTDHLPSVQVLKMQRDAMSRLLQTSIDPNLHTFTLGKV